MRRIIWTSSKIRLSCI